MATNPVGLPYYNIQGVQIYPSSSAIPALMPDGVMAVAADAGVLYLSHNGSAVAIASVSSSNANTSLSNLTTTSINQSLIPNADGTLDLGQDVANWDNVYAKFLTSGTGFYVDATNAKISNSDGSVELVDLSGSHPVLRGGSLQLFNAANSHSLTINIPSGATNYSITMPTAQGSASSVLQNNGSGVLSWDATGAMAYSAASAPNWSGSAPATVKDALDRIAAALGPIA